MIKRPFLLFIAVIGSLISGLLWFIESPQFARALKAVAVRYIPKDIGVGADFSELGVRLFPPGISIVNPKVAIEKKTVMGLMAGSFLVAERIDFNFRPFQIISGDIRVHEVNVINGQISLVIDDTPSKKNSTSSAGLTNFQWEDLLRIRTEALALQNVSVSLKFLQSPDSFASAIKSLKFSQWPGRGKLGYSLDLDVEGIAGSYLKKFSTLERIDEVRGQLQLDVSGLEIQSLSVLNRGVEIATSGQIKGNLLSPKELLASLTLKVQGELGEAAKMFGQVKNFPEGAVSFSGEVRGDLARALTTLHAQGVFSINRFNYQSWKADTIQAEAKWDASPTGGEITLVKASIASKRQDRVGGFQPGDGGKIEIGQSKWNIGSADPIHLPLHFDGAHIHWLGGPGIKEVYPLDLRLSGPIGITVKLPQKYSAWEVQATLAAWVDKFQFDNQRFQKDKHLSTVFKIPRIGIDGSLLVNAEGIHLTDLNLSLPHSKIHATGKIDFKTGYDLYANGPVQLTDFGTLADNEIRGTGVLGAHIHGPAKSVLIDIDTDLKDAYYLGLFLGTVKGRITWDDDPDRLLFTHVQLTKGVTSCAINGLLDLHTADTVNLDVKIPQGNIQDLVQIFGNLTQPLSWFPHELNGPVSGDLKIQGGISYAKLKVLARLEGQNWQRWGEKFKSIHLIGGYDSGKYSLDEFKAIKNTGNLVGTISYDTNKKITWDFKTHGFTVSDLDHIVQLDVPFRGKLDFESSGQGTEEAIDSFTQFELNDFSVRGMAMAPSQMSLKTQNGIARVQASAVGGQGVLDASYDFNPKKLSYIHGQLKHLDFSPVLLLLNSKALQDKSLAGQISGAINLNFHSGEIERGDGVLSISDYVLSRADSLFKLSQPVSVKFSEGNFNTGDITVQGKTGSVTLNLKSKNTILNGTIDGDLDSSVIEFFTSSISQATGTSKLDFALGGTLRDPRLYGQISIGGNSIRVASVESPFENVTGTLQLKQNSLNIQNIQAELGGGRINADGLIILSADKYPEVRLKGNVLGSKIKVYPFQYAKVSGTIGVQGTEPPYTITGNIFVDSALSREKILNQKSSGGALKAAQYAPPPMKQGDNNYPTFKLNVEVEAPKGIILQNDLFRDVEVKGNLTLVNTIDAPRILGTVDVLSGKLIFKDHVFQIQSASANFDNPTVINPSFDLNANTEVNGVKIRMYATGRPDKLSKIEFTSNPAMQESEILSLLAVGLTSSDAKKLSATDLSAVQQGEAASLVLHSLDFNRDLEDKTGFQVLLDESVNQQQGVSAFRPNSQADAAAAPQITIRRKLNDRMSLSAGSTVGAGTNKSNQINMDYSVNPDLSVSGVFNNYGVNGSTDPQSSAQTTTQSTQNSFGLDLKFQKRFK
jgi:autotransporter translocation and assembly factor TamB